MPGCLMVRSRALGRAFGTVSLIGIKGGDAGVQHMPRGIA